MKIAVLVSGGVDSSVALALLKEQGHDITAFYLKIWLEDELSYLGNCPWQEDLHYVQAVCQQLAVPLQVINLQEQYRSQVIGYTIESIKKGLTPNPDMLCNQRIKFGAFFDHIDSSFERVATGHYAQLDRRADGIYLQEAPDEVKDQTYFLAYMRPDQIARALFPIGHLNKTHVRALAAQYGLATSTRKDSQGICFLGKLKFNDFLHAHIGDKPGAFIEHETGKTIGTHKGFWYYTIGQRSGTRLNGGPWYVVRKDTAQNIVYVSRSYDPIAIPRNQCTIQNLQWLTQPNMDIPLQVKIRHGAKKYECTLELLPEKKAHMHLAEHDQGLAPGQFAVFYQNGVCLGAGVIT